MTTAHVQLLLLAFAMAVAGAMVALRTRRWLRRRKMTRRFQRGRVGEARAETLLAREGYAVLEEQTTRETGLWVDDAWQTVRVRADFLVEREGQCYVVEVKTGQSATRRQLFEYHHVYHADGLILADMETSRLHLIRFDPAEPRASNNRNMPRSLSAFVLLAGAALGAAVALFLRG